MITNFKQLMDHNKKFYDAFVDLKVVGWNSYSESLDSYTMGFFKQQLAQANTSVAQIAKVMKGEI